jgi:hypothetical protein
MASPGWKGFTTFAIGPYLSQFKPAHIFANYFFKFHFSFYSQNMDEFPVYILYALLFLL